MKRFTPPESATLIKILTRRLPCSFGAERASELGQSVAHMIKKLDEAEADEKARAKSAREDLQAKESEIRKIAADLERMAEDRDVRVELWYLDSQLVQAVRTDTREALESREASTEETALDQEKRMGLRVVDFPKTGTHDLGIPGVTAEGAGAPAGE